MTEVTVVTSMTVVIVVTLVRIMIKVTVKFKKKMNISPKNFFCTPPTKKMLLVLLSASVRKFSVSCMQDFFSEKEEGGQTISGIS